MDKIKTTRKKISDESRSLRISFMLCVGAFIILTIAALVVFFEIADGYVPFFGMYFIDSVEDLNEANADAKGEMEISVNDDYVETNDLNSIMIFYARNYYIIIAFLVAFTVSTICSSVFFFRHKLKKPLKILNDAADNISNKNLDFEIKYKSNDEMGKLCDSFEIMRKQLLENTEELWGVIDEQRRVQGAFSHDLRTPMTVIIGYTDLLLEYIPEGKISQEKLLDTIKLIKDNTIRLENFSTTMSNLQKMGDIEPKFSTVGVDELFEAIKENGEMVCIDKTFKATLKKDKDTFVSDSELVIHVVMNLITNSMRYAKSTVEMQCILKKNKLTFIVTDDGPGFSENALKYGFEAYYSESNEHFGLGLSICKLLCNKMNGTIEMSNTSHGAKASVTFSQGRC